MVKFAKTATREVRRRSTRRKCRVGIARGTFLFLPFARERSALACEAPLHVGVMLEHKFLGMNSLTVPICGSGKQYPRSSTFEGCSGRFSLREFPAASRWSRRKQIRARQLPWGSTDASAVSATDGAHFLRCFGRHKKRPERQRQSPSGSGFGFASPARSYASTRSRYG